MFVILVALAGAQVARSLQVGDAYEITTDRQAEQHGNYAESPRSTSTDRAAYVERVEEVRPGGTVLKYDLPQAATRAERASTWQFPFRVFKTNDGSLRLLDAPELQARVERWLKAAALPRTACGRLIFTWTAFRIECDPQSVVRWLETITLPERIDPQARFTTPDALAPAPLTRRSTGKLVATLAIDPEVIRRERARTDVDVAELMHKPLTFDDALKAHAAETITGTITVSFDVEADGEVRRRTRARVVKTAWEDGRVDTKTMTDTLTRTPLARGNQSGGEAAPLRPVANAGALAGWRASTS